MARDAHATLTAEFPSKNRFASRAAGVAGKLATACVLAAFAGAGVGLAPEPDPVPRRWELQVTTGNLQLVSMDVPNLGPRKFAYMTYTVTNNSGQDLLFAPSFELSDGQGSVIRSGRDVPLTVTQTLLAQTQNVYIQDQISIIGELLQGGENARDGIVIWPVNNLNPEQVIVYAAGFSGETKTVTIGDGKDKYILRKTLRLDFTAHGDLSGVSSVTFPLQAKSWIMR